MTRVMIAIGLALVLVTAVVPLARADDPVETGLAYLMTQQQADGGFTNGFSAGSDLGTTCDVILAMAAASQDPASFRSPAGRSPLDYLQAQTAAGAVNTVGLRAKVALALLASGRDPSNFGGRDLLADLEAAYDAATGRYGDTLVDHALAMLALAAAGRPLPAGAAQALLDNQCADGAWALFGGTEAGTGDTNTTALAIQALQAAGHDEGLADALAYLHRVQNDDGGFPYQSPSAYGTDSDANSTAYVLQALLAANEPLSNWAPAGSDPLAALNTLYDPDSGGFFWQAAFPTPNVLATAQAIPALRGTTFVNLPRGDAAQAVQPQPAPVEVLPASGGVEVFAPATLLAGGLLLAVGLFLRRRA